MKTLHLVLLLTVSTLLISCSDNLSRSKARKAILDSGLKDMQEISISFKRNYYNGSVEYERGLWSGNKQLLCDNTSKIFDQLYKSGLVIDNDGKRKNNSWGEKVQSYVRTDVAGFWYFIPIAKAIDVEISGIEGADTDKYRRVECIVICEWNDVGKMAGLDFVLKIPRKFDFKKYDDGWRLDQ